MTRIIRIASRGPGRSAGACGAAGHRRHGARVCQGLRARRLRPEPLAQHHRDHPSDRRPLLRLPGGRPDGTGRGCDGVEHEPARLDKRGRGCTGRSAVPARDRRDRGDDPGTLALDGAHYNLIVS